MADCAQSTTPDNLDVATTPTKTEDTILALILYLAMIQNPSLVKANIRRV
ncbi:MAG: hypothetical protein ACJ71D_09160 [Nitrososphaera sp.]